MHVRLNTTRVSKFINSLNESTTKSQTWSDKNQVEEGKSKKKKKRKEAKMRCEEEDLPLLG